MNNSKGKINWWAVASIARIVGSVGVEFLPLPLRPLGKAALKELDGEAMRQSLTREQLIDRLDVEFMGSEPGPVGKRLADDIARLEKRKD